MAAFDFKRKSLLLFECCLNSFADLSSVMYAVVMPRPAATLERSMKSGN